MEHQYDTIEELTLELALYPNRKIDILEDCARHSHLGWFAVAKDGNCALFDKDGNVDDMSKVKILTRDILPIRIEKINIPDGVEVLGENLFENSTYDLLEVNIPDSVNKLCEHVFFLCRKLETLDIPDNVAVIESSVFAMCYSLKSIKLPSKLTSIESCLFQDCSNLKKIDIPENVTFISGSAFADCSSLEEVILPAKIKHIQRSTFKKCTSLNNVAFKGKTIQQVRSMENYPFGISDESVIHCIP